MAFGHVTSEKKKLILFRFISERLILFRLISNVVLGATKKNSLEKRFIEPNKLLQSGFILRKPLLVVYVIYFALKYQLKILKSYKTIFFSKQYLYKLRSNINQVETMCGAISIYQEN